MLPNADPFEIFYTALIIAGLLLAVWNGLYAGRDWRTHRQQPLTDPVEQEEEAVVGGQVLINRWGVCVAQAALLLPAGRALVLPLNQAAAQDWTAYLGGIGILLTTLALDGIVATQFYSNRRFDQIRHRRARHDPR